MNMENLEIGILIPAFLAGMLVLATHVPLGQQVLNRGIVFIDLAIAQVAGLGVTAASALGFEAEGWRVQAAAIGAALVGAVILTWTEKIWPEVQEALIGVLFVVAACIELLILANNPHGGEHLKDLLVGQILWVQPQQLIPIAILYAVALLAWFTIRNRIGQIGFYILFALVVTQSVQLVGIYLVFASLIVPALAAKRFAEPLRLAIGYAVGIVGYVSGLIVSALFDLPTGAVIVVTLLVTMIVAAVLALAAPKGARATPAAAIPQAAE
jgi:zinc/manganese transport system permease protein